MIMIRFFIQLRDIREVSLFIPDLETQERIMSLLVFKYLLAGCLFIATFANVSHCFVCLMHANVFNALI